MRRHKSMSTYSFGLSQKLTITKWWVANWTWTIEETYKHTQPNTLRNTNKNRTTHGRFFGSPKDHTTETHWLVQPTCCLSPLNTYRKTKPHRLHVFSTVLCSETVYWCHTTQTPPPPTIQIKQNIAHSDASMAKLNRFNDIAKFVSSSASSYSSPSSCECRTRPQRQWPSQCWRCLNFGGSFNLGSHIHVVVAIIVLVYRFH